MHACYPFQEFLASVPKYLNLYDALSIERPVLATVPFVMALDGKKSLVNETAPKTSSITLDKVFYQKL